MIDLRKGFTLVELLIVIAVIGVLSVGVATAINVVSTVNKANLAKAKTFAASVENNLAINQVGKWSFEEGSGDTAKDISGYGNSGSLAASGVCPGAAACPTWKNATDCGLGFGGCLSFDGIDDYVEVPDSASLRDMGTITVAAWVNTSDNALSGQRVVEKGWQAAGSYLLFLSDDYVYFGVANSNPTNFYGEYTNIITNNRWYHLAGVFDGASVKIYVNGKIGDTVTAVSGSGFLTNTSVLRISTGPWSKPMKGLIDEVQIYSQALSFAQIQQLYAQGLKKHQLVRAD